jgi:hypothetical protein
MKQPKYKIGQRVWYILDKQACTGIVERIDGIYGESKEGKFQEINYGLDTERSVYLSETSLYSDFDVFRDRVRADYSKNVDNAVKSLNKLHPDLLDNKPTKA